MLGLPQEIIKVIADKIPEKGVLKLVCKDFNKFVQITKRSEQIAVFPILGLKHYSTNQTPLQDFLNEKKGKFPLIQRDEIPFIIENNLFKFIKGKEQLSYEAQEQFAIYAKKNRKLEALKWAFLHDMFFDCDIFPSFSEFWKGNEQNDFLNAVSEEQKTNILTSIAKNFNKYAPYEVVVQLQTVTRENIGEFYSAFLNGRNEYFPLIVEIFQDFNFTFPSVKKIKCDLQLASKLSFFKLNHLHDEPSFDIYLSLWKRSKTVNFIPTNPEIIKHMNENELSFENRKYKRRKLTIDQFILLKTNIEKYPNVFGEIMNTTRFNLQFTSPTISPKTIDAIIQSLQNEADIKLSVKDNVIIPDVFLDKLLSVDTSCPNLSVQLYKRAKQIGKLPYFQCFNENLEALFLSNLVSISDLPQLRCREPAALIFKTCKGCTVLKGIFHLIGIDLLKKHLQACYSIYNIYDFETTANRECFGDLLNHIETL